MAIVVKKDPGEDEDRLVFKFRKIVQREKILTTVKDRRFYKKPSTLKKEKLSGLRRKRKYARRTKRAA